MFAIFYILDRSPIKVELKVNWFVPFMVISVIENVEVSNRQFDETPSKDKNINLIYSYRILCSSEKQDVMDLSRQRIRVKFDTSQKTYKMQEIFLPPVYKLCHLICHTFTSFKHEYKLFLIPFTNKSFIYENHNQFLHDVV